MLPTPFIILTSFNILCLENISQLIPSVNIHIGVTLTTIKDDAFWIARYNAGYWAH